MTTQRLALLLTGAIAAAAALAVAVAAWQAPARAATPAGMDSVGLVDTAMGVWHLRDLDGDVKFFFYGNPGDLPFMGDWDCDGVDTPGLYRQSDGFVYLRNDNSQGIADVRFFFGNPGDVPVSGDFDGDGCDTVSIYRPSTGRFFVINTLGSSGSGLGPADFDFLFGNLGDEPIIGDWDGDGVDTVGLFRESTSLVYLRDSNTEGTADLRFIFGDPFDRHVAGDWDGDGDDSTAVFRPGETRFYLKNENGFGAADASFLFGRFDWLPIAGDFGDLEASATTTTTFPPGTPFFFEDGVHEVGIDIPAGTYRNVDSSEGCIWERTTPGGSVIASNVSLDVQIVTIEPGDGFFESTNCELWDSDLTSRRFDTRLPFENGHFLVPQEVAEGVWRSVPQVDTCVWELLEGFTGEPADVAAAGTGDGPTTVLVDLDAPAFADVVGFNSEGCELWEFIGP